MNAPPSPVPVYEFGDFRLEVTENRLVRGDGMTIALTPRVLATLRYLVEHSGRVLDKEMIMEAVWPDCVVEENNLARNISTLRRAFGDSPSSQRYIVTVPGRGYRFAPEVRQGGGSRAALERVAPDIAPPPPAPAEPAPERTPTTRPPPPRRSPGFRLVPVLLVGAAAVLALVALVAQFPNGRAPDPSQASPNAAAPLPAVPAKSIAVLPFANLSADPDNAYFTEGITDEILSRLSKVGGLKVISRTSTQKYKSAPDNLRKIARELGVAHIVEGSVQKSGETVRVTVQLIHAESDTHLWAETYDRKLTDIFQVETEIAQRIATALEATLTGAENLALKARPTANVEAHEACLKGRFFWNKRTVEGHRQAVAHFSRAIELDPAYAQAHAGLADALLFLSGESVPAREKEEMLARGRAALQTAIKLDDTLAEAHASLGLCAMNFDGDWAKAEREFQRAIELDPNYATARQWYGEFLADLGRFDEGIAEIKRAQRLDPLSVIINTDVAKVLMIARRYDEAVAQYARALELDPEFAVARGLLAVTRALQGRHEEAAAEAHRIRGLPDNALYLSWLGYIYGTAGNQAEAAKVTDRLRELARQTDVSPMCFAIVHAGTGEKEAAFASLEKVLEERAAWGAISLKCSPIFENLRADPRFADLLRRARFTP